MSTENGLPPPCLGDLVRDWLREEPSLHEHFFVHKQTDCFNVRMMCDTAKPVIATAYYDLPNHWYFLEGKTELSAANPKFLNKLESYLRMMHNRWNMECGVKL